MTKYEVNSCEVTAKIEDKLDIILNLGLYS